jgi:RNA polymerase sigma-70 factor (ECF subfamily)
VAVQRLRPRDREVIVLHYLEQHGLAEMAGLLGISQNAVEVRLHRARQRLKALLKDLVEP